MASTRRKSRTKQTEHETVLSGTNTNRTPTAPSKRKRKAKAGVLSSQRKESSGVMADGEEQGSPLDTAPSTPTTRRSARCRARAPPKYCEQDDGNDDNDDNDDNVEDHSMSDGSDDLFKQAWDGHNSSQSTQLLEDSKSETFDDTVVMVASTAQPPGRLPAHKVFAPRAGTRTRSRNRMDPAEPYASHDDSTSDFVDRDTVPTATSSHGAHAPVSLSSDEETDEASAARRSTNVTPPVGSTNGESDNKPLLTSVLMRNESRTLPAQPPIGHHNKRKRPVATSSQSFTAAPRKKLMKLTQDEEEKVTLLASIIPDASEEKRRELLEGANWSVAVAVNHFFGVAGSPPRPNPKPKPKPKPVPSTTNQAQQSRQHHPQQHQAPPLPSPSSTVGSESRQPVHSIFNRGQSAKSFSKSNQPSTASTSTASSSAGSRNEHSNVNATLGPNHVSNQEHHRLLDQIEQWPKHIGNLTCLAYSLSRLDAVLPFGTEVEIVRPKAGVMKKRFGVGKGGKGGGKGSAGVAAVRTDTILRISHPSHGMIGRLPNNVTKFLAPLLDQDKVQLNAAVAESVYVQDIMVNIPIELQISITRKTFESEMTVRSLEFVESSPQTDPFVLLLSALGMKPSNGVQLSEEDLERMEKEGVTSGAGGEEDRNTPMSAVELHRLYEKTLHEKVDEVEISGDMLCELRPYQKQAVSWMTKKENQRTEAAKLHPLWQEYLLNDLKLYVNPYTGKLRLDMPKANPDPKGGILADEMGLGKTIMVLGLITTNRFPPAVLSTPHPESSLSRGGTLVVCPMSMLSQWKEEIQTHIKKSAVSYLVHYGDAKSSNDLSMYDIVLTTFGTLASEGSSVDSKPLYKVHWNRVVLDEAHNIKGRTTQTAKAAFSVTSECRWCLTGTPIQNRLDDMFALLHFLRVDPWSDFVWWNRVIARPYEQPGPPQDKAISCLQKILKPLCLRRTLSMKTKDGKPLVELPPRTVNIEYLQPSEAERDFYDSLYQRSKTTFDSFVDQGRVMSNYLSILELLLRLRQCCDHPYLVLSRGDTDTAHDMDRFMAKLLSQSGGDGPSKGFLESVISDIQTGKKVEEECPICLDTVVDPVITPCAHICCRECMSALFSHSKHVCPHCRQPIRRDQVVTVPRENRFQFDVKERWIPSVKIQSLMRDIDELQPTKTKCLVFSQWTSMLDLVEISLNEKGVKFNRLDGAVSHQNRESAIKSFREDADITVFLVSLKVGGVGLTLTCASHVFLLDPWWNPAVEEQAIGRVHRISQKNAVFVKRYIVRDTVEEQMLLIQERKKGIAENALGVAQERAEKMTVEDLKILFSMKKKTK